MGGVVKPFPEKLMEVLDRGDMDNIITWLPHGRAFIVRHTQQLKEVVLPRFFKQSKFMSFTRQLNLWGFKRITKGRDSGAYYHELFLRSRPRLSMLMRRQKIKGTGIKLTPNPETEPNFYKISEKRPLPELSLDKKKVQPLPPITRSLSSNKKQRTSDANQGYQSHPMRNLYLQDKLEQKNLQSLSESSLQRGSMPPLAQPRLSFPDAYSNLDAFQHEMRGQRPSQRLSAPTTSADFDVVARQVQRRAAEEQQAIVAAQRLLRQVNGHITPPQNPVDDLRRQLLNAVQTLDDAQASRSVYPNVFGGVNDHGIGAQALPQMNRYSSYMQPNNFMPQQDVFSFQQNLSSQGMGPLETPGGNGYQALIDALNQTRQVAAAAEAQRSLIEKVASDIAAANRRSK